MNTYLKFLCSAFTCILLSSCTNSLKKDTFGYDLEFLKKHQDVVVLSENEGKSQLVALPELQGRVMTSSSKGLEGNSYGWMHYDLIKSGEFQEHINPFGGEDRFWIGPEGGQYSIFFKSGTDYSFDNWYTPKDLDTEPFDIVNQSDVKVVFQKKMRLINNHGFEFDIHVNRAVTILSQNQIEKDLGINLSVVDFVGYQSQNEIVNEGENAWKKESGLLSIWILGMFIPSETTTVILPYRGELQLNTSYFGTIPPERLTVTNKHVMFQGNGTYRFKLGLPPENVAPYVGSYDSEKNILTLVSYTFENGENYVNSLWKHQQHPYKGDVINSYNDGPLENGDQLGPFFELESSSCAKELKPGESIHHTHKTYHFEGEFDALNNISKKLLGKDLKDLK